MDFHLEHRLRLHMQPEHKNLYSWAIQEIDARGRQVGPDQIPWEWTLYFTATSCVLNDAIEITEENALAAPKVGQRQQIRMQLHPGHPEDSSRQTTFSMFGTDRAIKSFTLNISPIRDMSEHESCRAWGMVSHTTEIDFRNETAEDCVVFYLSVQPDTFARYGAKVAHGLVDNVTFSVGSVDGFYSEWSPSISTDVVKVLAKGHEQGIHLPPDCTLEPPRLGYVGKVALNINRRLELNATGVRVPSPSRRLG